MMQTASSPAYPLPVGKEEESEFGLSIRDMYVIAAMPLAYDQCTRAGNSGPNNIAVLANQLADAMLLTRKETS